MQEDSCKNEYVHDQNILIEFSWCDLHSTTGQILPPLFMHVVLMYTWRILLTALEIPI